MNMLPRASYSDPLAWLLGLLVFFSANVLAQDDAVPATQQAVIEIVRLQHRDPDLVREAIAPHLDERGSISQIDHNLIISTSRANLMELETLIAEVDVPLRQFLVRVDFNYGGTNTQSQNDGSSLTTVSTDDVRDHPIQTLQVTEGEYGYFNRSQASPSTNVNFGPFGLQLQQDNQESEQSFTVQANLRGDRVALALSMSQSLAGGADLGSQSQAIQTSVSVELNRWVTINPSASFSQFDDNLTRFATSNSAANGTLAVRVELVP